MKALLVKVEVNGVKFEKVCHSVFEATKALMAIYNGSKTTSRYN